MKINGVNTTVMNVNHKGYQVNTQNTKDNIDTVTLSTYQGSTPQKSSGELFAMYLDGIGYYNDMSETAKDELVASIKQNVYSFDESKFNTVQDSTRKVNNSVLYLKSLVSNIKSIELRQEFTSLIATYKDVTNKQINEYQAQLLLKEQQINEQESLQAMNTKMMETEMLLQQLESSKEQAEKMEDEFDMLSKCMSIAMRILNGHDVPAKDTEYLMKNNPELFEMAISMRQYNADKKKYDSILDEEDTSTEVEFVVSDNHLEMKIIDNNEINNEGES